MDLAKLKGKRTTLLGASTLGLVVFQILSAKLGHATPDWKMIGGEFSTALGLLFAADQKQ